MHSKIIALIFFFCFLGNIPASGTEYATPVAPFIWWSAGEARRLADGRIERVLTLTASPTTVIEQAEVWLRVVTPGFSRAAWHKGYWQSSEPYTLMVQSGEYTTVDIFARAGIEGKSYFAQIRVILGLATETGKEGEGLGEGPNWPEFSVRSNGEAYWPQTGHEFSLKLANAKAGSHLEVWSGQGELLDRIQCSEDVYMYTAPHDPALNRAGPAAAKPLIFVLRTDAGGAASFTQMVHRSRYAFWDKKAGLTVFAASFLCFGLAVGLIRRRERPCC